ncbi:MAG TPA: hypothetical protein VFW28_10420 [Micropepsaceae bacterium]|nr:hypothetical protein [Micropepsaceae bacterium]
MAADDLRFELRDEAFAAVLDLLREAEVRFAPPDLVDFAREDVDLPRAAPVFARLLLALVPREPAAFARPPVFALRRVPPVDALALRVVRRRAAGCARVPGSDILIPASANSMSKSPMSVISADWRFADPDFRAIVFSLKYSRQSKETPQA